MNRRKKKKVNSNKRITKGFSTNETHPFVNYLMWFIGAETQNSIFTNWISIDKKLFI